MTPSKTQQPKAPQLHRQSVGANRSPLEEILIVEVHLFSSFVSSSLSSRRNNKNEYTYSWYSSSVKII
jgi:hypothetical protein